MKHLSCIVCLSCAFVFPVRGRAQEAPTKTDSARVPAAPRPITIDDYFQIREVSRPEISPDGQWVAYSVATHLLKEDKSEERIWMVPAAGGDAIAMTAEGVSSSRPRWSPDRKFLAFLSARGESKNAVWLLNRQGGEAQRLTDLPQDVHDFEWAPDGKRLAFVQRDASPEELEAFKSKEMEIDKSKPKTRRPRVIDRLQFKRDEVGYLDRRRSHLYVFDLAARSLTQITSGDYDDSEPAWSPDGRSVAFTSNRSAPNPDGNFNTDIWVVVADNIDKGAHLTRVTTNPGADHSPAWSPDGKWITFVSQIDARALDYATKHLAIAASSGAEENLLTQTFDRNASHPRFSPDGRSIYFIADDDGAQNLCRVAVTGGEVTRPIGGRLIVDSYSLSKDGTVAAQVGMLDRPDEIYVLADGKLNRITKTNDALLAPSRVEARKRWMKQSKRSEMAWWRCRRTWPGSPT